MLRSGPPGLRRRAWPAADRTPFHMAWRLAGARSGRAPWRGPADGSPDPWCPRCSRAALAGGPVEKGGGLMAARKTSFYYAFLVLPPDQRRAIIAVWDFCRAVDDAVDEEPSSRAQGLPTGRGAVAFWRAELARCYDDAEPQTDQGRQLQPFVAQFGLPRQAFEDVIDGVAMDLETTRYQTFAELFEYCRRVASAVGLVCIRIFGCRSTAASEYAL